MILGYWASQLLVSLFCFGAIPNNHQDLFLVVLEGPHVVPGIKLDWLSSISQPALAFSLPPTGCLLPPGGKELEPTQSGRGAPAAGGGADGACGLL